MNRLVVGGGVVSILLGLVALAVGVPATAETIVASAVALLAIFGVGVSLWKLLASPDGDGPALPPPWTDDGALFDRAPERSRGEDALSGESFGAVLADAGQTARSDGTVEAGYDTVRPVLRRALVDALVIREGDRAAVEASLAAGSWTDNQIGAAVLDPGVDPPPRSLRARIEAWLFPERVVRRHLQIAVQAVAEAADDAVPTVPGQNAPRSVPVSQPRLEDLQRGVDGTVQRAVDPLATARGPRPPGSEAREVQVDVEPAGADGDGANGEAAGDESAEPAGEAGSGDETARESDRSGDARERDHFATDGGVR
ncbi:hypothetical protein ACAH01_10240 [Halomicrobium sp. HM KBTZ05]|uniref:DUF7269 family protein n=1 Tax=Halomicrobium sp. HM KBTZ05 TaxID=3242663 RepID=UPI003556CD99